MIYFYIIKFFDFYLVILTIISLDKQIRFFQGLFYIALVLFILDFCLCYFRLSKDK